MGEQESSKWEGESIVELKVTPQQVWPLVADFCSLHKWVSHVDNCYLVDGVEGEVGMIRCCESSRFPGSDGAFQWAKERLVTMDPSQMCLSYEIVDNNAGFNSYEATIRLFPIHDNDEGDAGPGPGPGPCRGCRFVWSFVADPVEGFTLDGLRGFFVDMAQTMAKRMEDAYLSQNQN